VVVAIDPTMPHAGNETMINDIEDMMTDASEYLHTALHQQAIFGKVIILVPDSWPDDPSYAASEGETVAGADIFIGNNIGCGACASPGRIQIDDGSMAGDTVVHEWGHYRFGLGDEYCDYVYKSGAWYQVYKTSAGWNRCTALQEIERDCDERVQSGAACNTTKNNVNGAKASIMHRQWNPGIDSFCDDSSDDKYKHNSTVNNHQNRIWSRRSTWSVIEAHSDGFKHSGGTTITYKDPVFETKKASKADIVLVIDVSGSMGYYDRIDNAARAAKNFVDRTEQGSYVAVVKFDDTATLEKGLTEITDDASRTAIKNKIPTSDSDGTTSIGGGMQKAKDELDSSTSGLNQVMMLLTDGEENTSPMIADVLPSIEASNIKVYCIGLGAASDPKLQDIADSTGGVYYFAQDGDIQALNEAYTSAAMLIASIPGNTVASETNDIPAKGTGTFYALIDSSLGQNTIFTFSGSASDIADIEVNLVKPDNTVLNSTYPGYSRDDSLGIIMFRIEGIAQSGNWTAQVINSDVASAEVNMEVTSSRAPSEAAITLSASLSANAVSYPEPLAIYASLISTESIIGAHVWAEVSPPSGPPVTVLLSDNGQGADRFQLDGIYSGFFTQYAGNGRYSVRVLADNVYDTAELGAQFKDGPGIQSDKNSVMILPYDILTTDESGMVAREMSNQAAELGYNFERVTSAGAFELSAYETGDNIGPCKVTTLSVINIVQDPPAIVLGWIAPGDDMDNGSATSYDLRYSKIPIDEANFGSASQVEGMDPPKTSGEEEQYTILDLDCNTEYYFAIKAIDEAGNKSEISNVISGKIDDTTAPTLTCPLDMTIECDTSTDPSNTGFATASDNCEPAPTVTYSDVELSGSCPAEKTITRTWTATDDAGNVSSCVQTIEVVDTTAPEISFNAPATIIPPDAPISFTATATDNCDPDPSIVITSYDCFFLTKKGKRIDKTESCVVSIADDTITILDSGGIDTHIEWGSRATDSCGNEAEETFETLVVNPAQ
jgi:Mg-chelatase subunit ChlD